MSDNKEASAKVVRDFLGSWEGRSLDTICGAFADDAVYHNVPVRPIEGITDIRAVFQGFPGCLRVRQTRHRQTGGRARTGPG
ncbi:nuclear transport factor 2 family protein [Mycobacterium asiaticum]|uniref:nuclear transport factor 2 family protein n=1 Tax=Mycobacterium asiaticum TaxID=1790 RepID=UPI000A570DB3|nr:nuclear transport factor 2 family protein [Mycobacterium asiaticum]